MLRRPTLPAALLTLGLVLGLSGAALAPVEAGPSRAPAGVDAPYAGFATRGVRAGGSYLGSHRVGGAVVYRIDPARKTPSTGFGAPTATSLLPGSGKRRVTVSDTQRAAWIVSKYGARDDDVQAAAVELAIDDLLVGGPYQLRGRGTRARLAHVRKATRVVRFARIMLEGSRVRAGEYQVTLEATPSVDSGSPVTARVRVVATQSGLPVPALATTFELAGQTVGPVDTDLDGVATATLVPQSSGPAVLRAEVAQLPEDQLLLLSPTDPRASRVVVAQVKSTRSLSSPVVVRGRPGVTVSTATTDVAAPSSLPASFAVTGSYPGSAPRAARATLFGPNPTKVGCAGPVVGTMPLPTTGQAAFRAGGTASADGWYAWRVDIDGDALNAPASGCGGDTQVHLPTFTLGSGSGDQVTVSVRWLPPDYTSTGSMAFSAQPAAGQSACSKPTGATRSFSLTGAADGTDFFFFTPPAGTYAIRFTEPGAHIDRCVTTLVSS